ncbi:MAG: hypothetical protein AAB511_03355 [Patescibacteria group bacterium]
MNELLILILILIRMIEGVFLLLLPVVLIIHVKHQIFLSKKAKVTQTTLAIINEEWITEGDLFTRLRVHYGFLSPLSLRGLLIELEAEKKITLETKKTFRGRKAVVDLWCKPRLEN